MKLKKPLEFLKLQAKKLARFLSTSFCWREHLLAPLFYLALSIGLTWPLIRNFTTAITGTGDAWHHLWTLWHTREALAGRESLFYAHRLYYPLGISLLAHATGPLLGLMALPFWPLGPEAAYNGTVLISMWLTGYCMYLLARSLGFQNTVALFAGTVLLAAPIHLAAIQGHLPKVFLALPPLVLLSLHRALDLERSKWWALITALVLLLTLLHSGEQFVFSTLAVGLGERGLRSGWRCESL